MANSPIPLTPRTIHRSVNFEFRFRWLDANRDPIPLNGDLLIFAYRDARTVSKGFSSLFEIELGDTNANGSTFVVEDVDAGQYLLTLTNADTTNISISDGYWWMRRRIDDNPANDQMFMHGPLRIKNP